MSRKSDEMLEVARRWAWLADKLTWKQFQKIPVGVSYRVKAEAVKRISKGRELNRRADRLINAYDRAQATPDLTLIEGNAWISRPGIAKLRAV